MSFGIIYKITNKINGKIYIGQTITTLRKRISHYKRDVKLHLKHNNSSMPIVKSISKYGFNQFVFEKIDSASSRSELNEKETFYIKSLKCQDKSIGYNILPGGYSGQDISGSKNPMFGKTGKLNPFYGKKHPPHVIAYLKWLSSGKNSPMFGQSQTDYQKEAARQAQLKRWSKIERKLPKIRKTKEELSAIHRENAIKRNKEIPWTNERRAKMSARISGENNPKAKMNMEIAQQLRDFYHSLSCETIKERQDTTMKRFNVGRKTVWETVTLRRWIPNGSKKETSSS